ncbi:MAG TPA: class I mannose-6-phosphate isomerase [Anaerolineae bacterium]|nr:class I mannose-6-phosphate isomerase [Anaerolineae bacterium]
MEKNIYPLTFEPMFRDYLWGGRNLVTKLGRSLPEGVVAESWEISGHPSSPTIVDRGPLTGNTLPRVLDLLGADLVGTRSQSMLDRGKFPLLVKLLDANKPLSVQVHPDDKYAANHEYGELGKTEMWYIIYAEPGSKLIYGLKPGVTPDSFRHNLKQGTLETCLHELPVLAGDAIFIPSGSVHAIMDGLIIAEIQQNSDATYRVYDWNRLGPDGKARELHVDKALEVINFDQVEPGPSQPELITEQAGYRQEFITRCPYFNVERFTVEAGPHAIEGHCDGRTFEIWGVMTGQMTVTWAGEPLPVRAVHFCLLPAKLGEFTMQVEGPATLLRTYVPA